MQLVIKPSGTTVCLYDEDIDFQTLGEVHIQRASHVEPTPDGRWMADLRPVGGPVLGPCRRRSIALSMERQWLEAHWLPNV